MSEYLIIDAFNFAHSFSRPGSGKGTRDMKRMVYELENFSYQKDKRMTVVFDGIRFKGELVSSKTIAILFSQPSETADELIGRFMHEIPTQERLEYVLVSDDHALRDTAVGLGLRVRNTRELSREMKECAAEEKKTQQSKLEKPFNNPFVDKL